MLMSSHVCTEMEVSSTYLGWAIDCYPKSDRWGFRITHPETAHRLTDEKSYPYLEEALEAAKHFIEARQARDEVSERLSDLRDTQRINSHEYNDLLRLISQIACLPLSDAVQP
jgi:hypothetical protein